MDLNRLLRKIIVSIFKKRIPLLIILIFTTVFFIGYNYFKKLLEFWRNSDLQPGCLDTYTTCPDCLCSPVDVVYTWVNGSDPIFLENMRNYARANNVLFQNDVENSRFDDKYELKYSLRSLEKYLKWIRNVYIVTNGQIPYWLNMERQDVKVIPHSELVDEALDGNIDEILPTFSSSAIEIFIHRIPNLSDRFIYINDDILLGAPVSPGTWCDRGHRKVMTSWTVPYCLPECPWVYLADGSCDQLCNNEQCQYDGGDCSIESKNHKSSRNNKDYIAEEQILDYALNVEQNTAGLEKQIESLNLLKEIIKKEKERSVNDTKENATKIDFFKNRKMLSLANKTSLENLVEKHNKKYILDKKKRKKRTSPKIAEKTMIEDKRKLDNYAKSLIFTNKLFNNLYGFEHRKVPAHIPFLLEKSIVEDMQIKFKTELDVTKRNRFRRENDLQFSFTYYHFMLNEYENISIEEIFDDIDTDMSGTWSDREIRTMLAKKHPIPLQHEVVRNLEDSFNECADVHPELVDSEMEYSERYMDSNMPKITLALVRVCPRVKASLHNWFGKRLKYKSIAVPATETVSAFKQLVSNALEVLAHLDALRKTQSQFICINDNLDSNASEQNEHIRALLIDFYEALYPMPSKWELKPGLRNKFAYLDEYRQWSNLKHRVSYFVWLFAVVWMFLLFDCTYCFRLRRNVWRGIKLKFGT